MKLDKLDIPESIQVHFIQRKCYGKYVYKLLFEIDISKLIKGTKTGRYGFNYTQYINRLSLLSDLSKKITSRIQDKDYRIRSEGTKIGIYTNSEDDINDLTSHFENSIIGFYRPLNEAHVDLIEEHTKVLVRSSLFEKKYRFKVYLKPSWTDRESRFSEVKDWLLASNLNYEVNGALNRLFNTDRNWRNLGYTMAVYFTDAQDLMMFQLRFNEKILKIEEAVLLSEL